MLSLYFRSAQAIQTTLLVSIFIVIAICAFLRREKITHWGWLIVFELALGLFTVTSIPSIVNCILAAVIVLCGVLFIYLKRRKARQTLFFILSAGVFLKIPVIEISRIFLYLQAA